MAKRRFWPGYRWRILAHHRSGVGRRGAYTGERVEISSANWPLSYVEFDELVIDDWFHLEQMDDRTWGMRIGEDLDINVTIDAAGKAVVSGWDEAACALLVPSQED